MATVDPYEAVIKLAQGDIDLATLTGNRIAQQHKYGQDAGEWALNAASLVFRPVAGLPELYVEWQRVQLEAICYADTPYKCGEIHRALIAWTRQPRRVVTVSDGLALVYYVLPRANARLLMDADIRPAGMPGYLTLIEAAVNENVINI